MLTGGGGVVPTLSPPGGKSGNEQTEEGCSTSRKNVEVSSEHGTLQLHKMWIAGRHGRTEEGWKDE